MVFSTFHVRILITIEDSCIRRVLQVCGRALIGQPVDTTRLGGRRAMAAASTIVRPIVRETTQATLRIYLFM